MNSEGRHPSKRWRVVRWILQINPQAIHIYCTNKRFWEDGKQTECGLLYDFSLDEEKEFIVNNIDEEPLKDFPQANFRVAGDAHKRLTIVNMLLNSAVSISERVAYANVSGGKANLPLFSLLLEKYENVIAIVTTKRRGGADIFIALEAIAKIEDRKHEGNAVYSVWLKPKEEKT